MFSCVTTKGSFEIVNELHCNKWRCFAKNKKKKKNFNISQNFFENVQKQKQNLCPELFSRMHILASFSSSLINFN